MCRESKPDRALKLYEGHVRWIMNRPTPEERLAAWETVVAIAFPKDEDKPYMPPEQLADAVLTPVECARRDAYDIFSGLIKFYGKDGGIKDRKKVEAGRLGAAARFGRRGDSSAVDSTAEEEIVVAPSTTTKKPNPNTTYKREDPPAISEDDFGAYEADKSRGRKGLTDEEKAMVAEWDRKIPDAKALQSFIEKNFLHATRPTAVKSEFCEYAYQKLAKVDGWISRRDGRPYRDIRGAIHYTVLEYNRQLGDVKRAEDEEKRKNLESEFQLKNTEMSHMSSTEIADIERKRRRKAEKETIAKIMKGEL